MLVINILIALTLASGIFMLIFTTINAIDCRYSLTNPDNVFNITAEGRFGLNVTDWAIKSKESNGKIQCDPEHFVCTVMKCNFGKGLVWVRSCSAVILHIIRSRKKRQNKVEIWHWLHDPNNPHVMSANDLRNLEQRQKCTPTCQCNDDDLCNEPDYCHTTAPISESPLLQLQNGSRFGFMDLHNKSADQIIKKMMNNGEYNIVYDIWAILTMAFMVYNIRLLFIIFIQ